MGNTFLEKSYVKCDGKAIHRPFCKKSKSRISLNILKCYKVFFIVCSSGGLPKYIKTNHLLSPQLKYKKRSKLVIFY